MSIRAIARLAGMSTAAVSMALHDSPRISQATKQRVRQLAKRLGYALNPQVSELMSHLRFATTTKHPSCFGVFSFYDEPRPWERSLHLARLHGGMVRRAEQLGYVLHPLWLRAPGMTLPRFCAQLEALSIEGLLCLGSPDFDEQLPRELERCAMVAQGLSIVAPLHRVVSDAYKDMFEVLDRLYALGYRRPGLMLGHYEDVRNGRVNASAYLGWCEQRFDAGAPIPVLRVNRVAQQPLKVWLNRHQPDVILFVHQDRELSELVRALDRLQVRTPDDIGLVAITQILEGTGVAGLQENQQLMGEWAVELLIARIMNGDIGRPTCPRIEMVESCWIEGSTLRAAPELLKDRR